MTEAEARAALRAFVAVGDIEPWIAEQRWEAVPGGWRVVASANAATGEPRLPGGVFGSVQGNAGGRGA